MWFDKEESGQHFWNTIFHKCLKRKRVRVNAWIMCFCNQKAGTPVVSAGATLQKVGSWVLIYCQEGGIFPSQAPINWLAFDYWKTWGRSFSWQQPRHLVERGAFHWQHGSGHWSIVFTSALLLRHSRHFGHNIEQFHFMTATHEPKMPVAGLKEGRKEWDPK